MFSIITVPETTALITALGLFLGQLTSIYLSLKNGMKADLISGRVDGQLTAANTKIAVLTEEVKKLVAEKADMKGLTQELASKIPKATQPLTQ